jgi:V/A-type H+-transporting ATPase subunit F
MKIVAMGDKDTTIAFKLVGVESKEVNEGNIRESFKSTCSDNSVGILVITQRLAESIRNEIDLWRYHYNLPIIVEVPDKKGRLAIDPLARLIKKTIGIELKGV